MYLSDHSQGRYPLLSGPWSLVIDPFLGRGTPIPVVVLSNVLSQILPGISPARTGRYPTARRGGAPLPRTGERVLPVSLTWSFKMVLIRVFPKVDHSANIARIVLVYQLLIKFLLKICQRFGKEFTRFW